MVTYSQWHLHLLICFKTSENFKFLFSFFDLSELMKYSLLPDSALRLRFPTTAAAFQPQLKVLYIIKSLRYSKFWDMTAAAELSVVGKCTCGEPRFYSNFIHATVAVLKRLVQSLKTNFCVTNWTTNFQRVLQYGKISKSLKGILS